ncbi:GNAT family N-acetyltransferase [Streptomyces sp. NPDC006208]|uniref:GNAT family N-acetyltransferase n=1 Tax=Streptomyces sp. NPDC006208 TaxID=3156734 RepID=UPI00339F011F
MTCPSFSGLAGLAVVANGFKRAQTVDEQRPYHPVLEYLVIDRRVRDKGLGRQLARHVLQEVCTDVD